MFINIELKNVKIYVHVASQVFSIILKVMKKQAI